MHVANASLTLKLHVYVVTHFPLADKHVVVFDSVG